MRRTIRQQDVADDDGACCPNRPSVWQGQPGGLGDGSRWSFRGKGGRPPGGRVGWPSSPEGGQTWGWPEREGWGRVRGGRSGERGNDHREAASDGRAPRRGARLGGAEAAR